MKTYGLCTLLAVLAGYLNAGESHTNGFKLFLTNEVTTDHIKDGQTTTESLIDQIDTNDFSAVMSGSSLKYLGI